MTVTTIILACVTDMFVNRFPADRCNIKRFMAAGPIISRRRLHHKSPIEAPSLPRQSSSHPSWGLTAGPSLRAVPAIIPLPRRFTHDKRDTYYGFFSANHNMGESIPFPSVCSRHGLATGFFGSDITGIAGCVAAGSVMQ